MMRDLVAQIQPAEPPIGQMQRDLLAEPALMSDAVAVTMISIRIISSGSSDGRPMSAC
jgi:hypothetical protein